MYKTIEIHLMLLFNEILIIQLKKIRNLNTSYVIVQQKTSKKQEEIVSDLNTSYVIVQLNVNPVTASIVYKFKYILCYCSTMI